MSAMPTDVLTTKLFIPLPRPNALARPALIARLNAGLHRALTLVVSPAGFGKTTLVSAWVAGLNRPVAWLSLDPEDRDVARLLTHLVATLQTRAPALGEAALALLRSPEPPAAQAILTSLLNDVAAHAAPLLIVLDDYHAAAAAETDRALAFLVEHLPPQLHLVLISREDPALPLARLRARDQVTELRAADLRFTSTEAAAFLREVMGFALAADHAALLAARTEGWAAGLQLAALSLRDATDIAGRIRSFAGSHHLLLDYLVEEVLGQQPEPIQRFLLHTSILDRLSGSLCDAVNVDAATPGQATLEALERANLFLVPLDDERRWYRYHQLFAEALRQQLTQRLGGGSNQGVDSLAELHARASLWFEGQQLEVEAFYHAAAAQDIARLARLAERSWQGMDRSFQLAAWLARVRQLSEAVIRDRPVLSVQLAWALMNNGDLEGSEARLRDAERWLEPEARGADVVDAEQLAALPAMIAFARAYSAQARGESAAAARHAQDVLALSPGTQTVLRAQAAVLLGLTSWASGELETAYGAFAGWVEQMRRAGNLDFALVGVFGLIEVRAAQGRLRDAVEEYRRARREVAGQGPVASYLDISYALLQLERGEREVAAQTLREIEPDHTEPLLVDWRYRWLLASARLSEAAGDVSGALDLLDQARQQYVRTPLPDLCPLAALDAQLRLREGRLDRALAWARERGLGPRDELSYLHEFEHLTAARVWLADYGQRRDEGALRDALTLLSRLLAAAEAGGRAGSAIMILVLQSRAHAARGDLPAAHGALERALTLAEPEGYVQVFVDEGQALAALLAAQSAEREAQGDALQPYRAALLAAFRQWHGANASVAQPVAGSALNRSDSLAEPLSEREREVLQLIAEGLRNQAIAERLYLSLHTVKVHARNIYAKLGVASRTEAAARGRALGILSAS